MEKEWIIAFNRTLWNWNHYGELMKISLEAFNRTLWNWNKNLGAKGIKAPKLLIVPYGIETCFTPSFYSIQNLLIVPYGIETNRGKGRLGNSRTFNRTLWNWNPINPNRYNTAYRAFNRTLWNWNQTVVCLKKPTLTFNRTLWNWNYILSDTGLMTRSFNRTLWNWNCDGLGLWAGVLDAFNRTLWNWNACKVREIGGQTNF